MNRCAKTHHLLHISLPLGAHIVSQYWARLMIYQKANYLCLMFEQYSDMNEWKDRMESELERDLVHPFIHAPPLSQSLEVSKIPTVFFVNSDGEILHRTSGLTDKSILTLGSCCLIT